MLCFLLSGLLAQATPTGRFQDPSLVAEEVLQAHVTSVEDGDSLVVRTVVAGDSLRIHIAGVDAPEMSQSGGPEAKAFLAALVSGKTITVRLKRTLERLARVEVDGSDVSLLLIRNGMAWHCPRFAKENDLAAAEAAARRAQRGFWSRPQPMPPWLHRGVGVCWQQEKTPATQRSPAPVARRWQSSVGQRDSLVGVDRRDLAACDLERGRPSAFEVAREHSRVDEEDAVAEPGADAARDLRCVTDDEPRRSEPLQERLDLR